MHLSPDPDFEEFALDCIRLSNQEKSPTLRLYCGPVLRHSAGAIQAANFKSAVAF